MGGIEEELVQLIDILHKMGTLNASGQPVVKYGDFVKDPVVTNTFEAPFGILRSARKRKIVAFDGELLLSPVHDQVHVVTYDVVSDSDIVCKASGSTHIKEAGA